MKSEVLNALLTARTLFDSARTHCFVRDRHNASAGLVILQDAVELVFYACLIERGIDEAKTIEKLGFDELIGELKRVGIAVPKSGTLKAMNKQRVLVKHHAQLAEPTAVVNFYQSALVAVDAVLKSVIGKTLHHIVIADAISDAGLKGYIEDASVQIERRKYFDAMVTIRKALFLSVEREYDVREWENKEPNSPSLLFNFSKAPSYTKNKAWIQENVKDPISYIQLDHAQVRSDMIELGIDPEEFFNVWRLTPGVYQLENGSWAVKTEARTGGGATEDNARYCLDVVIAILVSQQSRRGLTRWSAYRSWRARLLRRQALLSRASPDAALQGVILEIGEVCNALYQVSDFSGQYQFVCVFRIQHSEAPPLIQGYIPLDSCEIELVDPKAKEKKD
jgi:hypothetical protein